MNRSTIIAGFILSAAPAAGYAQTPGVKLNLDSGIYVGAGAGRASISDGCFGVCDTKDVTWTLFAGYQFNKHLAVETAYSDFGELTTSATLVGVPITARYQATAVELVGIGSLPITDQISFYAKAGVYRYESDATTSGAAVGTSNDSAFEFTLGAGIQYAFTPHFGARFEWQRYMDLGAAVPGAQKEDLGVWRLSARYKF